MALISYRGGKNLKTQDVFWGIIGIFIVALIIVSIFNIRIRSSIRRLTNEMEKIAQGDLTKKLKANKIKIIKELIVYSNDFMIKVRRLIGKSTEISDRILINCDVLNEDMKNMELHVVENVESITTISDDMNNQVDKVVSVRSDIESIVLNHGTMVRNSHNVEKTAMSMMESVVKARVSLINLLIRWKNHYVWKRNSLLG